MKRFSPTQGCALLLTLVLLLTALAACTKDPPVNPDETDAPVSDSATDTQAVTDTEQADQTEKETDSESAAVSETEAENDSQSESESSSESESDSESESETDSNYKLFSKNGIEFFYPKNFTVSHQSGTMTQLMDAQAHASIASTITVNINKIAANKDGTPRYDAISMITKVEDFAATHLNAENIELDIGEKRTTVTYEETAPSSQRVSYYTYIQIVSEPAENGELTYASIQVREYTPERPVSAGVFVD